MSQWSCHLSKATGLTVGEKVVLPCEGATEGISQESLVIKDAQLSNEVPALTLLSVLKFDTESSEYEVTGYRVGAHTSDQVVLFDGKTKIDLKGFDWKLDSVLKQDPSNPPQMIGSYGMWELSYPIWFWILLLVILVSCVAFPYMQFKKIKDRKKAFEDLKNLETALNPLDAFYKGVRRMEKALEADNVSPRGFVDQIDKDFRVFLSRSLEIPAHLWTISQILNEIKKKYPKSYRDHGDDIKKYFSELTKLKGDVQKKDCLFIMERAQKLTETVDKALSKKARGTR